MKKEPSIVVGIDFSASSPFVLRQAADMAGLHGGRVLAVHVLNMNALHHWARGEDRESAHEALMAQARHRLSELVEEVDLDVRIDCEVRVGRTAEELGKIVRQEAASLLVIAANDMSKKRLGSTASRCARTVEGDVLIARGSQSGDFRKIVVCTDLSMASGKVIESGVDFAEANNAELEVVHVIFPPEQDYWGASIDAGGEDGYSKRVRRRADEKMTAALAPFSRRLEAIKHRAVILESAVPSVELSCHIADTGADLAVLGTRVHSKLASIFVGTNAERLLHDAPVSVLAVRF